MRFFIGIILVFISISVSGQKSVYVSCYSTTDFHGELYLVNVETCFIEFIGMTETILLDIAINPLNDEMYGVSQFGDLYKIDKTSAGLTLISSTPENWQSLTFSVDGNLYASNGTNVIYIIDTNNGSYYTAGSTLGNGGNDLTFYNGLLYYATVLPDLSLVQTNTETFTNPEEFFYSGGPLFGGLATLGCPSSIFGFSAYYSEVWKFEEDLLSSNLICSNLLPSEMHFTGAAAVYNNYNCEFGIEGYIIMPNVFTPNFDNINDTYLPKALYKIESFELQILNRWGNLMFETTEIGQGWDGNQNEVKCTEGNYFWIVTYTSLNGNSGKETGTFQLIR